MRWRVSEVVQLVAQRLCSTKEANLHAACVVLRVLALRHIKGTAQAMGAAVTRAIAYPYLVAAASEIECVVLCDAVQRAAARALAVIHSTNGDEVKATVCHTVYTAHEGSLASQRASAVWCHSMLRPL